nr:hypothetical protein [Tanacetum cinerariifolium]
MNSTSKENASKTDDRIDKLANQILTLVDIFAKKVVTPAPVKAVEESFVACSGNHAYYNCPNTDSNQPSVCVETVTYNQIAPQNRASNYMASPGFTPVQNSQNRFNQNHRQGNNFNRGIIFMNQASTSGTLLSNTILNTKGEMKAITTRSGVTYEGPSIPTLKKTLPKPYMPYPSRLNDQKLREKATNQMENFFQIFQELHFDISFVDALLLMPKFASTIKRMDVCDALADLGTSINLMPLFIWKNLSLPELTPTRMTLELVDRSITRPKGFVEDVFIKVGKFHVPTNFVLLDFKADPQ